MPSKTLFSLMRAIYPLNGEMPLETEKKGIIGDFSDIMPKTYHGLLKMITEVFFILIVFVEYCVLVIEQ